MNKKTSIPKKKTSARPTGKKTEAKKPRSGPRSTVKKTPESDQFGGLVNKGLELAEAGVTLGMNLVHKFGDSFQGNLLTRISDAGKNIFSAAHETVGSRRPEPDHEKNQHPASQDVSGITNRLPIFPGGAIRISFSINNDSPSEPKKIKVRVEGFEGDLQRGTLEARHLSVVPAEKEIAPADFDKFLLTGTIPRTCKGDIYRGTIVVSGDEAMSIPLTIHVTGRT